MVDKNLFMETLHAVQEIAKTSPEPMDRATALAYFKDMELSGEQEELVYQFLMLKEDAGEAVLEPVEQEESESGRIDQDTEAHLGERRLSDSGKDETQTDTLSHFQLYLDEIGGITAVEAAEEEALYQRLLSGDTTVIEAITNQWLKRIVALSEEYKERGVPLDDLVQEGNMGLLLGLNVLSGNSGEGGNPRLTPADLPGLLKGAIRESMEQYLGEESGGRQQSEAVLAKVSLVHQAREFLTKEKGEAPSLRELSAYTKIPAEEISDILSLVKEQSS